MNPRKGHSIILRRPPPPLQHAWVVHAMHNRASSQHTALWLPALPPCGMCSQRPEPLNSQPCTHILTCNEVSEKAASRSEHMSLKP